MDLDTILQLALNDLAVGCIYGLVALGFVLIYKATELVYFNGPEVSFGPDRRQGANSSFLAVVKGGRWTRLTEPLRF